MERRGKHPRGGNRKQWALALAITASFGLPATAHAADGDAKASAPSILRSSRIEAGPGGFSEQLPGHVTVTLAPGTIVEVMNTTKIAMGALGNPKCFQVKLLEGTVQMRVAQHKPLTHSLLVRAPRRISALSMGGHATVATGADTVATASFTGKLLVAVGNSWRPLEAGKVRRFGSGTSTPTPLMAPPTGVTVPPMLLSINGSSQPLPVSWSPVPGAHRYVLNLSGKSSSFARRLTTDDTSLRLPRLRSGLYSVQVQAVDPSGLPSRPSAPANLQVVGVKLPPGSFHHGSDIELPKGQKLTFDNAAGLEMSYGGGSPFLPAPSAIGARRKDRPTVLYLRTRGARKATTLKLRLRSIVPRVSFTPRQPRWPRDSLVVKVDLRSGTGHPLPDDFVVKPKLFINIKEVKVEWKRHGSVLVASVPTPDSAGPWVVRVRLRDAQGHLIGHDFVEVARARSPGQPKR